MADIDVVEQEQSTQPEAEEVTASETETPPANNMWKKVLGIGSNVLIGVMGILIVTMLFFLFKSARSDGPPVMFNHQLFIVRSDSMNPAFRTGSILLVKQIDPTLIKERDIITYQRSGAISVTHRVVEVINEGGLQFVTRGDANNVDDPMPVMPQEVVGKVSVAIPFIGFALGFARTKGGFVLLLVVPGMLIIVTQAMSLIKQIKEEKKIKAEQQAS